MLGQWRLAMERGAPRLPLVAGLEDQSGDLMYVLYEDEPHMWHQRVLLRPGSSKSMLAVTGERVVRSPSSIWWVLTPDGDVYPEELAERCMPVVGVTRTGLQYASPTAVHCQRSIKPIASSRAKASAC